MVYEVNVMLKFNTGTNLPSDKKLIPATDYVENFIIKKQQKYIAGDGLRKSEKTISFSQRYPSTASRKEILDFVDGIKGYASDGKITIHNCFHDEGGVCNGKKTLAEWGDYYAN